MNFKKNLVNVLLSLLVMLFCFSCKGDGDDSKPNIIIIMADDLGYGDVSAYNQGTLNTPGIDKLAKSGLLFTNGYATAATCTPSRYSLLTGDYPWRNNSAKILPGDAPLLIDTSGVTLPKLLKSAGYTTGVVGKWHLGLGNGNVDWNNYINLNPNAVGFDYSYIMAATNDRVPNVYVEDGHVCNLSKDDPLFVSYKKNFPNEPTGAANPEKLRMMYSEGHDGSINNGVSRIGFQKGGKSAQWVDEDMADIFLEQSIEFIKNNTKKPFFLYYALHQPHVPRIPHSRFVGATGMGPRGDAIAEADWCIGELMKALEKEGLSENTIVVFTSDNGPIMDDGYVDQAEALKGDHTPMGHLRGGKYSLYEAGTRVPFIVKWEGHVKPGISDALVCQVDLMASLAKLTKQAVPQCDSEDILDALMGKTQKGRENLIIEGLYHRTAFRRGKWLMIPPYSGPAIVPGKVTHETGFNPGYQLYNLQEDEQQLENLASLYPRLLKQLQTEYSRVIETRNHR
ncbi:MAG: arylsulfatase [Carboxylicivirga sp.]|jgi:arylsulfatase A-like enzyme|nr:arylsulfatase [Carboxylicivirga sp.]MCT4646285.1 arylsulfatase [Carboxylicivirga sp.]